MSERDHDEARRESANKPVEVLRDGALRLPIFRNRGEQGDSYAMVPGRIYTDKETGEVREASSLSGSEALRMANLLTRGYERVGNLRKQDKASAKERDNQSGSSKQDRGNEERER